MHILTAPTSLRRSALRVGATRLLPAAVCAAPAAPSGGGHGQAERQRRTVPLGDHHISPPRPLFTTLLAATRPRASGAYGYAAAGAPAAEVFEWSGTDARAVRAAALLLGEAQGGGEVAAAEGALDAEGAAGSCSWQLHALTHLAALSRADLLLCARDVPVPSAARARAVEAAARAAVSQRRLGARVAVGYHGDPLRQPARRWVATA